MPRWTPITTCSRRILDEGVRKDDRTGTGTLSVFGHQMRFDLRQGFPLVTTKQLHLRSIIHELLWFLTGDTNVRALQANGVTIWDEWADATRRPRPGLRPAVAVLGEARRRHRRPDRLGPRRDPAQSRIPAASSSRPGTRPTSTGWRWRPATACSSSTSRDGRLSCQLYQRSADVFLGVPFNIASYALLTAMIAQVTGLGPGDFVHTFGDAHLYREPPRAGAPPADARAPRRCRAALNPEVRDLFAFRFEDIAIEGYDPHPAIRAPVAV